MAGRESTAEAPRRSEADLNRLLRRLGPVAALVSLALFLVVVVIAAIRSGLFDFGSPMDGDEVAALWTFAAASAASALTFVGVLFTSSYNERTATLAERTEERENRTAAASFLGLLSTPDGRPTAPAQVVGVVVALVALNHRDVAYAVAESAVRSHTLPPATEALLIDQLLTSDDANLAIRAAGLYRRQAAYMTVDDSLGEFAIVESMRGRWPIELPEEARYALVAGIGRLLCSQPLSWWIDSRGWVSLILYEAVTRDQSPRVTDAACVLLEIVGASFDERTTGLWHAGMEATVAQIRAACEALRDQRSEIRPGAEVAGIAEALRERWAAPDSAL